MPLQFDGISIIKKSNIIYGGYCINHSIKFKNGATKNLGVILPTEEPLIFETKVAERIEIISGRCWVQIGENSDVIIYYAGQSFYVPKKSQFKIISEEIIDYICHIEGH
ncbi:DUF1255 family protein [Acinetobacter albensis]|uniref:pyrimidine/purine nucleoside phosphorylase n=1 Tax=Acinetobacter albensis TaxID=1673609 RepID=UPI001881288A|nr:pyrimidine/purine nucleoside phosphorylase [Acinetobacter albensis]MBE9402281.1 DUF1255 family protein [Acinetobacter albensis]